MTAQLSPRTVRKRRRSARRQQASWLDRLRLERHGWPLVLVLAVAAAILFAPKLLLLAPDEQALMAEAERDLEAGELAGADAAIAKALEKQPGRGEAYLMRARIAIARGDGALGAADIDRAVAAGLPGERVHAHLGAARIALGDWQGAEEALEAKVAERDLGLANRLLATLAMRRGDLAGARDLLGLSRGFDADSADLWVDYAVLHSRTGEEEQARRAAREALRIDPDNRHALIVGGGLAADHKGPSAALPFYERGLARWPGDMRLLELKAGALGAAGRHRDMLVVAFDMLERAPGSASAHYLLAWLAVRVEDDALAAHLLDRAAGRMGDAPAYLLLGGIVDYRLGRYREAAERFGALLDVQPGNKRARQLLGASLIEAGEAEAAWRVIEPLAQEPLPSGYTHQLALRIKNEIGSAF